MKNRFYVFIFFLFTLSMLPPRLSASGTSEKLEDEIRTQKDEWILCITNFDTSSLPANRTSVVDVVMAKLVENINKINYRTRISPEYAYYEQTAMDKSRSDAAKALAAKQNERSLLIYRGDPAWRYRRNLEAIDAEIERLRTTLDNVNYNVPNIKNDPVFRLTTGNMELNFPAAPAAGAEYKFCLDQGIDAILTGSITGFHERFIVAIKLFTLYTQSFVWEDSIIFSPEDVDEAMEEIIRRLVVVLSGNENAVFIVRAEPEDAFVLINRTFTGVGVTPEIEYPPGVITVTATADDHESITFETELFSGELTDIRITLNPIEYGNVEISGLSSGSVYLGSLYVGDPPLMLRLPLNQMTYVELETSGTSRSTAVFSLQDDSEPAFSLVMPPAAPRVRGRIENSRSSFYWAWGATWITGIAAWLTYHSYSNSNAAVNYSYNQTGEYNQRFFDNNRRMRYVSIGSAVALGAAAVLDAIFLTRYFNTANRNSTPIIDTGRN